MRVIIDGKLYDSTVMPVLLIFDEGFEKDTFKMNRFVSAPESSTKEERQKLIDTNINDFIDNIKVNDPNHCKICGIKMARQWINRICLGCDWHLGLGYTEEDIKEKIKTLKGRE